MVERAASHPQRILEESVGRMMVKLRETMQVLNKKGVGEFINRFFEMNAMKRIVLIAALGNTSDEDLDDFKNRVANEISIELLSEGHDAEYIEAAIINLFKGESARADRDALLAAFQEEPEPVVEEPTAPPPEAEEAEAAEPTDWAKFFNKALAPRIAPEPDVEEAVFDDGPQGRPSEGIKGALRISSGQRESVRNSVHGSYYIEKGGVLEVRNATHCTFYVENGATLITRNDSHCQFYHEAGATISTRNSVHPEYYPSSGTRH